MKVFAINLLAFIFSFHALAAEINCSQYDKNLLEIHQAQAKFKVNSQDSVEDYVKQINIFSDALSLLTKLNQTLTPTRDILDLDKFFQKEYPEVQSPFSNPEIKTLLSILSSECSTVSESRESCNNSLDKFRDHSTFLATKNKIQEAQDKLKFELEAVYLEPSFNKLSKVARFVASEKLRVCPEMDLLKNNGTCNAQGTSQLSTLAHDSLSAVQHYFLNDQKVGEKEFYRACKALAKDDYKLTACAATDPTITKVKLKKEKTKREWAPVLKTSAIIVLAGGVVAATAYLVADAFEGKPLFTKTIVNNYSTTNSPTTNVYTGANNYYTGSSYYGSSYGYNPYQSMYGSGQGYNMFNDPYAMYNPYQYGYNPYMNYGMSYGFNPYTFSGGMGYYGFPY
jgi:hypothetical protein